MERFWERTLALKRFTGILDSYVSILSLKFSEITILNVIRKKDRFWNTIACTYTLFKNGFILKDEFIEWSRCLGSFVSTNRSDALRVNYHKDKRITKFHIILQQGVFCGAKGNACRQFKMKIYRELNLK